MTLHMEMFNKNGYLIIEGVADDKTIDLAKASLSKVDEKDDFIGLLKRKITAASYEVLQDPRFRFRDLYVKNPHVHEIIFSPRIIDVLMDLCGEPLLAFQNLGFTHGSELRTHRDSSYVAMLSDQTTFYGVWIALEDVLDGCGELVYYPGSHLLPAYQFAENSTHWVSSRDGIGANDKYHCWLEQQMQEHNIAPVKFLAKKGDCIIWHNNLAHAGNRILDPQMTRYSLVTHFCPIGGEPRYYENPAQQHKIKVHEHCHYSSAHYALGDASTHRIIN